MPRLALFPGTFDPITSGHLDILERAARLFDEIEVTVAINTGKTPLFSLAERLALCEACVADLPGVSVAPFEGLLVDHAGARGASALVRGLRQVSDFDYEIRLAQANRRLHPGLETVFLMTNAEHAMISSTIVRDVYRWGGDLSTFVPPQVLAAMQQKRQTESAP